MPAKPPNPLRSLSTDLRPIVDLELSIGNAVAGIAEPAGTECPFGVFLARPFHFEEIARRLTLPPTVKRWECRDPHYDQGEGFVCSKTRHTVFAPFREDAKKDNS